MSSSLETELIITDDGSHSLFVPHLNEHYHSTHGAIQEARHVFIQMGLYANQLNHVNVLEIGFGTGLNAYLTLIESIKANISVYYTALELYPLDISQAEQLNYAQHAANKKTEEFFMMLHKAPWSKPTEITDNFVLHKIEDDFSKDNNITLDARFDVIYFDAFAPEKQPEMWTQHLFDRLFSLCNKNAVVTTYCAKGIVRRMFEKTGFKVERLPGPPGKREMLRCIKE